MKRLYRRLLQVTSTLLLLFVPYMRTWSCGPDITVDELRFSLFQPEMAHTEELDGLHYCTYESILSSPFLGKKDYDRNCREWQQQTGAKLNDIYYIQYDLSPDDFLYAYRHNQWDELKDNSFIQALLKNRALLDYFAFAKGIEFNQVGDFDPWETGDEESRTLQLDSLQQAGTAALQQVQHEFLKERYAFQVIKMHYYLKDTSEVISLYDTYLRGHSSMVTDWALLFYALVQSDELTRTKLLCETFGKSDEKKSFIFTYLSRRELDTLLAVQPDLPDAQVLKGLKNTGRTLSVIQAIHQREPHHPYLPVLVTREINKLEDWVQTPAVMGYNPRIREITYIFKDTPGPDTSYDYFARQNLAKDQAYLGTFRNYLESIFSTSDSNYTLYGMAIAHLYNMDRQYAKARAYLKKINPAGDSVNRRQWLIEQMVADVHTLDINSPAVKAAFATTLKELGKKNDQIYSMLLLIMSQEYQRRNDVLTAALLFQQSRAETANYHSYEWEEDTSTIGYFKIAYLDQHGTPADVDKLLAFKHKQDKTAFEQLLVPKFWAKDDFYKDVKLCLLVRQQQFRAALAVAEEMDPYFWRDNYEYNTFLTDIHIASADFLIPGEKAKQKAYPYGDKRAILRDIVALSDSLARDPQNAALYYRMGNVYYNISSEGRCWMLANYGKSYYAHYAYGLSYPDYGYSDINRKYQHSYYHCEDAMKMYSKALEYGKFNRELCAKALLMLSVCDKDRYHFAAELKADQSITYTWADKNAPFHSPYLDLLKSRYGDTEMYADAKMMCPDVK